MRSGDCVCLSGGSRVVYKEADQIYVEEFTISTEERDAHINSS